MSAMGKALLTEAALAGSLKTKMKSFRKMMQEEVKGNKDADAIEL